MTVPPQDYVFIADEAGISNDRFTVVGGLCMHRETLRRAYDTLKVYRDKHNMHAELKWSKVSRQKLGEYMTLVEYFFAMNNSNHMHFHSIVFDSHRWAHKKYNEGDGDVGLSKLYYQLMLHKFVKLYGNKGTLYVRVDHRTSSTPLEDIRRMLNRTAARDHDITSDPVKQFVSADSKTCDLLQLNDVILGSVCAARNGRHLVEGGNPAKRKMAEFVLEKSGLETFEKTAHKA
ncbi:MAG: DUF3800 domain-containing protein [Rhodobiaceae bacterium]|nr:DUF3800 domain-containing protein [Rhodobiaceae bacterium]MCC0051472.1 DUF3800 domain-containing protein [Rhodobiaceae bacterium]